MCTANNLPPDIKIGKANQDNGQTLATNVAEGGTGNLWITATPPLATTSQVQQMASIATLQGKANIPPITYGAPALTSATSPSIVPPAGNTGAGVVGAAVGGINQLAAEKTTEEAVKAGGVASKALNNVGFGIGAGLILLQVNNAKKSAIGQADNIKAHLASKVAIAKNREGLENLQLRDTLDQINTKAIKTRSSFQTAKGENLGGATYNAMLADFRRNELNMRERVVDQVTQNRIQVREDLILTYGQALRDIDKLNDSVPSYAEVALKIALTAVSAYATGGAALAAGVGAGLV